MQSADAVDAGADVRHPGELEQALHRAVLAEGAVQDREHDVDGAERGRRRGRRDRECRAALAEPVAAGRGRQRPGAVARRSRSCWPRSARGRVPRRRSVRRPARSRARSSAHRRGRRRGAAGSRSRRRRVVSIVVSVVVSVVVSSSWSARGTKWPTKIVTMVFGSCWVLPGGSWEMTTPSKVSTSVSCFVTATLKPAAFSVAFASASRLAGHVGSGEVCGPFETERLTVEPFVGERRAARHLARRRPRPAGCSRRRCARPRSRRPGAAGAPSSSRARRPAARRPASARSSS